MILHSCISEFKSVYPTEDTSGFEKVFRLNDGSRNAFVVLTSDGRYPKIFNREKYSQELLERETEGILERYYYTGNDAADDKKDWTAAEEAAGRRKRLRKRIQIFSNIFLCIFLVFEIFLILKGGGLI